MFQHDIDLMVNLLFLALCLLFLIRQIQTIKNRRLLFLQRRLPDAHLEFERQIGARLVSGRHLNFLTLLRWHYIDYRCIQASAEALLSDTGSDFVVGHYHIDFAANNVTLVTVTRQTREEARNILLTSNPEVVDQVLQRPEQLPQH